jgi:hypothetical protein
MIRKAPKDPAAVERLRREVRGIQARAKRPGPIPERPVKEDRVRLCVQIMARCEWVSGVTGQLVAEACGVSVGTVAEDAGEASRLIRESVATQEDLRAMVIAGLQHVIAKTAGARKPQFRTTVEAYKALAGIAGIEAPKELNLGGDLATLLELVNSPVPTRPGRS